jgi:uncharacterized protein (DUF2141 family)
VKPTNTTGLLLLALAAAPSAAAADVGQVTFEITNLRRPRGVVQAALFNSPQGFPDGNHAFRYMKLDVEDRAARGTFLGLPPGEYAILVFHDEDEDGELDRNFLGIPREGYGASRNSLPSFSAPKFKGNRFALAAGESKLVQMRLRY